VAIDSGGAVAALPPSGGSAASAAAATARRRPYPLMFFVLVLCTGLAAASWLAHFFEVARPALRDEVARVGAQSDDPLWARCYFQEQQLAGSCLMIVACFLLFALYRLLTCVKPIGEHAEAAQSGALGPSQRATYMVVLVVMHGPLVLCTASSLLLLLQELTDPQVCGDGGKRGHLLVFASGGLLVGALSCALVVWHACLAARAGGDGPRKRRRGAPAGCVDEIATVPYDPGLFGLEEGRAHYAECPICLGEFGPGDEIKVPRCGHAFHRECLARWLRRRSTCAICRRDVALAPAAWSEGSTPDAEAAVPGVAGAEGPVPEVAAAALPPAALDRPSLIGLSSWAAGGTASSQAGREVHGLRV